MSAKPPAAMLAAAALALAGCATAEEDASAAAAASGRQCFLASQVNGFRAIDDDSVHVFVGTSDVYALDIVGACPDIDWSTRIGIAPTGGGSWVCSGLDAELVVPGALGANRCPVTSVRRLSEEEARAVRGRD